MTDRREEKNQIISSVAARKKMDRVQPVHDRETKKKIRKLEREISPLLLNSIFRNSADDPLDGERPLQSLDRNAKQCCHNRIQDEDWNHGPRFTTITPNNQGWSPG